MYYACVLYLFRTHVVPFEFTAVNDRLISPSERKSFLFPFCQEQESIVDEQENQKDENIHLRRFLRVLANFLITCSLGGSGYLIYFVVKRSQEFATRNDLSWYEKNEVMMVSSETGTDNLLFGMTMSPVILTCFGPAGDHHVSAGSGVSSSV